MRVEADTRTAELPGLPPYAREPKDCQALRRLSVAFKWTRDRTDNCGNCRHAIGLDALRCTRHDFPVAKGSMCSDYEE